MKKPVYFLLLILMSCSKGTVELTILNNHLVCVDNFTVDKINQDLDKKLYDSLSSNIVQYKITNNSNKKYFFTLHENDIRAVGEDSVVQKMIENGTIVKDGLSLDLYHGNVIMSGHIMLMAPSAESHSGVNKNSQESMLNDNIRYLDDITKRKLYAATQPSVYTREILENSFVLYPGETKYFTSLVHLPYRENQDYWLTETTKVKPDFALLTLINTINWRQQYLSKNQKKEIKENGLELFDGTLVSNKVPVKFISMP